jgi:hypothetical protein
MFYKKTLRILLVVALVASSAIAQQSSAKQNAVDAERLRTHITYLASDQLEGRRTGEKGAEAASRYIAEEFKRLDLKPGAPDYFQKFPFVAAVELGKGNAMTLATRDANASPQAKPVTLDLRVGDDWMPLGFSSNANIETAVVRFVGYGITAADQNYDDYKDADAAGNVALALSGTPDGDNPHGRFTRAGELRFKAAAARAAGARALVIIASEDNFKDERLTRLRYDNAGGDAGLPVVVISRPSAAKILGLGSSADISTVELDARLLKTPAKVFEQGTQISKPPQSTLTINTDIVRRNVNASNVVGVLEGTDPQ